MGLVQLGGQAERYRFEVGTWIPYLPGEQLLVEAAAGGLGRLALLETTGGLLALGLGAYVPSYGQPNRSPIRATIRLPSVRAACPGALGGLGGVES